MRLALVSALVVIGVCLAILADVFLKNKAAQQTQLFAALLVLTVLVAFPLAIGFGMVQFGLLFILWEALTLAIGIAVVDLVFGETLSVQKLGARALVLALAAMVVSYSANS